MLLSFSYSTVITFSDKITDHTFATRSVPFATDGQRILKQQFTVIPNCPLSHSTDAFGNVLISGFIGRRHDIFAYEASGLVETAARRTEGTEVIDPEPPLFYAYPTALTQPNEEMAAAVRSIRGMPGSAEWAMCITSIISSQLVYRQGVTTIDTSAAEAWSMGCGVCQDFAHIAVAMCRLAGRPARYVCGLMIGEGATHAWAEVYDGERWIAFDPTNSRLVDEGYIKMAHGRDYADCSISRGVFRGGASQDISVSVDVWKVKNQ